MTRFRLLIVMALMTISSLASAQEAMNQPLKKGSKAWTELEATLRDADLEWLCQGKYFKPKRQDCVDSRGRFWADQFFRDQSRQRRSNQGRDVFRANGRRQNLHGGCARRRAGSDGIQANGSLWKCRDGGRSHFVQSPFERPRAARFRPRGSRVPLRPLVPGRRREASRDARSHIPEDLCEGEREMETRGRRGSPLPPSK